MSGARSTNPTCPKCRRSIQISKAERRAIYERDGWACGICHEPVPSGVDYQDPSAATLDHITPRSLGGSDKPDNLRLAHRYCNTVRGNSEWRTLDDIAS